MGVLTWILIVIGLGVLFLVGQGIYLSAVLSWEQARTNGLGYYGLPPAERERFKRSLRRHTRLLSPILSILSQSNKLDFKKISFRYRGVAGPGGTCTEASFARAAEYQARPEDVFVVTQMKCGTTWMQHVVYQVLTRGRGDLVGAGQTLYSVSPWIEGLKSVSMEEAPLIGTERPSRIVKTHLPAQLCPASPAARYLYVARHPVSCLASCIDFVATNAGGMTPDLAVFEEWFTSPELMWWGTWPDHVKGWWERGTRDANVLFVFFEDMKRDLAATVRQVAQFLGMAPLTEAELAQVVEKCGFNYMQRHQDAFEMMPPHVLQTRAELFVRGTADRHLDVPEEVRTRVLAWCREITRTSDAPLARVYPELG
jgi:Sulfotransferase domain